MKIEKRKEERMKGALCGMIKYTLQHSLVKGENKTKKEMIVAQYKQKQLPRRNKQISAMTDNDEEQPEESFSRIEKVDLSFASFFFKYDQSIQ